MLYLADTCTIFGDLNNFKVDHLESNLNVSNIVKEPTRGNNITDFVDP